MYIYPDISDIPLKPNRDTFVDEPKSLEDVHIDDLVYQIENDIEDINRLHSYHAIAVLSQTLQDIITLQTNEELLQQFRKEQLAKYDIHFDDLSLKFELSENDGIEKEMNVRFGESVSPYSSSVSINEINDKEHPAGLDDEVKLGAKNDTMESIVSNTYEENKTANPPYIPIETLTADFHVEERAPEQFPSALNEKVRKEVVYNRSKKVSNQSTHLCKTFNLVKTPSISIDQFLSRIKTYSPAVSVSCYVHCAFMLFKLCILSDVVRLTENNVYRFILASIRCSTKKLEDIYQKQKTFATVGGVSQKELFRIEMGFLYLCNFNLIIGENVLNIYLKSSFIDLRKFCKGNSSLLRSTSV